MNTDAHIVGLHLQSRPQTLALVRGMLSGVAERLEMDPELLDDLKTAVSEACNNVVLHAYHDGPGPMDVELAAQGDGLRVTVRDAGVGIAQAVAVTADGGHGIGLSVIEALSQSSQVSPRDGGGTEVVMEFPGHRDGVALFTLPSAPSVDPLALGPVGDGEVAVTLSPVSLLAGVLGRLARTLAATAHFSLDRFSDVYLITDTLSDHAARTAAAGAVAVWLSAADRRLTVSVGPLRVGTGGMLTGTETEGFASTLSRLADEVSIEPCGEGECVQVVVIDRR